MSGRRNQRSSEAEAYRGWYKTAKWRAMRLAQLRQKPLCAMCQRQGRVTAAAIVDHVEPHRGEVGRFFDPANLQSLCKPHHDATKQAEERRGYVVGNGADGRPLDPRHPWNHK